MLWSLTLPLLLGAAQESPGWKTFTSKEGGFTVSLPCTPAEERQRVQTATGHLDVVVFVAEGPNETSYVVGYSDLPAAEVKPGSEKRRLDFARDGAVAKARGTLRSERLFEQAGHPGRELVIEQKTGTVVRLRILVVGRRLYQIMAVGPGSVVQHRDGGTFFLDSFRLDK